MKTFLEREFKSEISEKNYQSLLQEFNIEGQTFTQTNHYFDNDNYYLLHNHITLRIREKNGQYKITAKSKKDEGHEEKSILITKDDFKNYLENGFNTLIIDLGDIKVKKQYELTTIRAKTPYNNGTLFFDKSLYYGKTDYEVEFEINENITIEEGMKEFQEFLLSHNIKYQKTEGKSKRAYKEKNK